METRKKKIKDFNDEERLAYYRVINHKHYEKNQEKLNAKCLSYYYNIVRPNPDKMQQLKEKSSLNHAKKKEEKRLYKESPVIIKRNYQEIDFKVTL